MDLGPHATYIIGAYAGVIVLTVALIFYVAWNSRRVKAKLADLEARGIRRRSAAQDAS
jgi:heme exporter protein D